MKLCQRLYYRWRSFYFSRIRPWVPVTYATFDLRVGRVRSTMLDQTGRIGARVTNLEAMDALQDAEPRIPSAVGRRFRDLENRLHQAESLIHRMTAEINQLRDSLPPAPPRPGEPRYRPTSVEIAKAIREDDQAFLASITQLFPSNRPAEPAPVSINRPFSSRPLTEAQQPTVDPFED